MTYRELVWAYEGRFTLLFDVQSHFNASVLNMAGSKTKFTPASVNPTRNGTPHRNRKGLRIETVNDIAVLGKILGG